MKSIWYVLMVAAVMTACNDPSGKVKVSGEITGAENSVVVLKQMQGNMLAEVDSFTLDESGKFNLTAELNWPNFFVLEKDANNYITMILHPGEDVKITATGEDLVSDYKIQGSKDSELLQEFTGKFRSAILELSEMGQVYQDSLESPNIQDLIQEFDARAKQISEDMRQYTLDFIDNNMGSMATLMALYQQLAPNQYILDPYQDFQYYSDVDSVLYSKYPESEPVRTLHQHVADFRQQAELAKVRDGLLGIGAIPPDIALPSPQGDTIRLSDQRGKYVLLDFWAAWCGPCRDENPNLVENYKLYKDRGFEIFQVSLDKTREEWLKGIEDDKLQDWVHVSDLNFWNSSVVSSYSIQSIPASFLLDPDGKIIAKDLRGASLGIKLAEIFP